MDDNIYMFIVLTKSCFLILTMNSTDYENYSFYTRGIIWTWSWDTSYGFIIRTRIRQSTNIVYIPYVRAPQGVSTKRGLINYPLPGEVYLYE